MRKASRFLPCATLVLLTLQACHSYTPTGEEGIQIDMETRFQTIEGFGSCIVNYKDFPEEYSDPQFIQRVVQDMGLSIVRVPLMEHTEWINDDDDPDHFNWDGFWLKNNIERKGIEESMWLMQQFKAQGVERFMGTPWSPPEYMKTTRSPIQGGYLRADMLDEYAEYMAAQIILAKKNYGIDLNWVSIQNELLFVEFYRSCIYNPWLLKETVRALMHKFEKEGIRTKILMPEDMLFVDRMLYFIEPTMNDPETSLFKGHFCTHRRGGMKDLQNWVKETGSYERQTWMTETSGHQQTWEGALKMASDIQDYLVYGNNSAWIYWQLSGGREEGAFSILVDGNPTPKYYASKHFYRFIRPGAVRVEASSKDERLHVSAFHHPVEGTLTAVLINKGDSAVETSLNFEYDFEVYQSTESDECISLGLRSPGDELVIPANGIVTLVERHLSLKILKSLPPVPEAWEIPEAKTQGQWGNPGPFPRSASFQLKADGGNVSILQKLKEMDREELLSHRRQNGWTWLHATIMNGDGDAVKYLIDLGADVNAKANDGWTPLHMAAATFVDNGHKEGRLADYSKYDLLKLVMDAGTDLSAVSTDGWTALHAACANAHTGWRGVPDHSLQKIRDLVEAGVDLEARDVKGRTALHWAAMQGYFFYTNVPEVHSDVVDVLIEMGANVNAQDDQGRTPLHHAATMAYEDIVLALLEAGSNPNQEDIHGETALDIAMKSENETLVYLLQYGRLPEDSGKGSGGELMDNGGRDHQYGPELLKAAWEGKLEKVKELLAKGADTGYVDTDGFNALQRARDNGHDEIVELIENTAGNH